MSAALPTPHPHCNNNFEDFTLAERAVACPFCLSKGTHCEGNYHVKRTAVVPPPSASMEEDEEEEEEEEVCIIRPLTTSASSLSRSPAYLFSSYPFGPEVHYDHSSLSSFYALFQGIEEEELHQEGLQSISLEMVSFQRPSTTSDSEIAYCARNLDVLFKALGNVCQSMGGPGTFETLKEENISNLFKYLIMKKKSLPEPVLVYQRNEHVALPLVASEAKGLTASIEMSIPQATLIASECCFALYRATNSPIHEIMVPFILTSGLYVQFGCSYLIEPLFPCSMMLTRPYYLFSVSDLMLIRKWILVLAKHCKKFISTVTLNLTSSRKDESAGISCKRYFFKPMYIMTSVDNPDKKFYSYTARLLWIFHLLSKKEEVQKYIHFPVGNIGFPAPSEQKELLNLLERKLKQLNELTADRYERKYDAGHPILIYEDLTQSGWSKVEDLIRSNETHDKELFLRELEVAIGLLKESGVVLTDLRAQNMFYCKDSEQVKIKIIDFDDAYPLNYPIPNIYYAAMQEDPRYPHGFKNATNDYYDHFYKQILKEINESKVTAGRKFGSPSLVKTTPTKSRQAKNLKGGKLTKQVKVASPSSSRTVKRPGSPLDQVGKIPRTDSLVEAENKKTP